MLRKVLEMKINRVHLYNFSSYAGDNTVDLRTSGKKNVVLIGGNNGAGKTSLFTAIKLALYGPQCFKYQDKNHHYFARIRELINHDAFLSDKVKSFVELDLYIPTEREHANYTVHREWTVVDKHIEETFCVYQAKKLLDSRDVDFFQNYLYTIIPPNLFDFFFFDGEEVGEFFSTGAYNRYIKNAVLTLSGYDTFSIIEKFCGSFIAADEADTAYNQAAEVARRADEEYSYTEAQISALSMQIEDLRKSIAADEIERETLEYKFIHSGGLSEDKRKTIEKELAELETIKSDKNKKVHEFVETLMPLYITRDLVNRVYAQLLDERAVREYQAVLNLLSPKTLSEIIGNIADKGISTGTLVDTLSHGIAEHLKPAVDMASFHNIHDLSRDQESQVVAAFTQISSFDQKAFIRDCNKKNQAAKQYEEKTKQLREALPEVDAAAYFARISQLSKKIEEEKETTARSEAQLENAQQKRMEQQLLKERARKSLYVHSTNKTAYMYTEKIGRIMNRMIQSATSEKFKQVETLTMEKFNSIIRKENYIQLFELDADFNINLYKRQLYTIKELASLVKHGGIDALELRLGPAGIRRALEELSLKSTDDLRRVLSNSCDESQLSLIDNRELDLYNRIELNQLSRGEKQVFVLSLYWAIIKSSNQSVPFIIDTPFARIDTEHREKIAELFFPEVSEQVIILSTDEEVVDDYYVALKPKIAKEYLLDYVSANGKTVIQSGYFKEVAQ